MPQIVRLETFHNEFVCFVRVTTEDGAFGWGQTSTYNADITAQVFHRQIVPCALGANCEDIAGLERDILTAPPRHNEHGERPSRCVTCLD